MPPMFRSLLNVPDIDGQPLLDFAAQYSSGGSEGGTYRWCKTGGAQRWESLIVHHQKAGHYRKSRVSTYVGQDPQPLLS